MRAARLGQIPPLACAAAILGRQAVLGDRGLGPHASQAGLVVLQLGEPDVVDLAVSHPAGALSAADELGDALRFAGGLDPVLGHLLLPGRHDLVGLVDLVLVGADGGLVGGDRLAYAGMITVVL